MKPILLAALAPLALAACNDMPSRPQPVATGTSAAVVPAPGASGTPAAPPVGMASGSATSMDAVPGAGLPHAPVAAPPPPPEPMAAPPTQRMEHPQPQPQPQSHEQAPPPPKEQAQ